jgi:hypothetical protein
MAFHPIDRQTSSGGGGGSSYTHSILGLMGDADALEKAETFHKQTKKARPKLKLTTDPAYEREKARVQGQLTTNSYTSALSSSKATGWTTHKTTDGRTYYAHERLGTTWVRPKDMNEAGFVGKKGNEVPMYIMSPSSKNRGMRRISSWSKFDAKPANAGAPMPPHDGTFFEHVLTFNCDWFDWSIVCTYVGCWIGIVFILVGATLNGEKGNLFNNSTFFIGFLIVAILTFLWFICLGVPWIAYNTTLGHSRY